MGADSSHILAKLNPSPANRLNYILDLEHEPTLKTTRLLSAIHRQGRPRPRHSSPE